MDDMKILFLITQHFPYGCGEEFLETEINYLSESFDKIYIVTRDADSKCRQVPNNVILLRFSGAENRKMFKFIYFLLSFLSNIEMIRDFFYEIKRLYTVYNLSLLPRLKILLATLFEAKNFKSYLLNVINKINFNGSDQLYLYTYWCTSDTYAISKCKNSVNNCVAITRCHGHDLYLERNVNCYLPFRKNIADKLDRIFFVSDQGRDYFINTHNIKSQNNLFVSRLGTKRINKLTDKSIDGVFRVIY